MEQTSDIYAMRYSTLYLKLSIMYGEELHFSTLHAAASSYVFSMSEFKSS